MNGLFMALSPLLLFLSGLYAGHAPLLVLRGTIGTIRVSLHSWSLELLSRRRGITTDNVVSLTTLRSRTDRQTGLAWSQAGEAISASQDYLSDVQLQIS